LAILCLEMANYHPPNRKSALRAMFNVGAGIIPGLEEPDKWSASFKEFLACMLKANPEERATADELLQVRTHNRQRIDTPTHPHTQRERESACAQDRSRSSCAHTSF
jgi:hypothetical protein